MLILLAVLGAILIFGKGLKVPDKPGTDASNQGGTSTPTPTRVIPPFYAWNNASTGNVPKTIESFTPLDPLHPIDRLAVPHNNLVLTGYFNNSPAQSIKVPISSDLINDTEQTSVSYEQATSWRNNNVGGSNVRQVLA